MNTRPALLLLAALLAFAPRALAEDTLTEVGAPVAEALKPSVEADPVSYWTLQLDEAAKRVTVAEANLAAARDAYQDWRQRKYPRGKRKGEVVGKIDKAEAELRDAWAALPETYEAARRAGTPNGVLRRYDARLRSLPAALAGD